jgi:hypothetical protein
LCCGRFSQRSSTASSTIRCVKGGEHNELFTLSYQPSSGATVIVTLDKQANIRLLDSTNYQRYRRGERHQFYGGLAKASPVRLQVPHAGSWHVVIDLGGYAGTVRASVSMIE